MFFCPAVGSFLQKYSTAVMIDGIASRSNSHHVSIFSYPAVQDLFFLHISYTSCCVLTVMLYRSLNKKKKRKE